MKQKTVPFAVSVILPVLRVEIRVPPPPRKSSRSGALVVDLHDLHLFPGGKPEPDPAPTARFSTAEEIYGPEASHNLRKEQDTLLGASWKRIVIAYASSGESKAHAILSLGPLAASGHQGYQFGVGTPPTRDETSQSIRPQLVVSCTAGVPGATSPTAVAIDLPSIHVELSKSAIDGLQLWADDLTQLAELAFAEQHGSDARTKKAGSGDSSLIGSRYFARTNTAGSGTDSGTVAVPPSSLSLRTPMW